ncbi:uncharacterized protein EAF01_000635 [Botrytis porri]|uniref:uncharacterized protein n=1 Tax=Botrytis porri TaxID=87229 RepID=UPI00190268F1|nr:uncharacterized protein EAF01_000635 [Botrytis porri]KAF7914229.1 hypothetical protein EAF01_000635 [Botrytis porri]
MMKSSELWSVGIGPSGKRLICEESTGLPPGFCDALLIWAEGKRKDACQISGVYNSALRIKGNQFAIIPPHWYHLSAAERDSQARRVTPSKHQTPHCREKQHPIICQPHVKEVATIKRAKAEKFLDVSTARRMRIFKASKFDLFWNGSHLDFWVH